MKCPTCGVEMNQHAEKLDLSRLPSKREDEEFGTLLEVHTCPECGMTHTQEAE
jgi:predicted RNA-binding Zn-ribbon protein involved in translation (DUF1610 family)